MRSGVWWCAIGMVAVVLGGCAGQGEGPAASGSPTPAPYGNGAIYLGTGSGVQRHPILADGSVGAGTDFAVDGTVRDGRGDAALTGAFEDVFSIRLDVRDVTSGAVEQSVDADWCGGEGNEFRWCVLLDPSRVVRTSTLWPGRPGGTVTISSLQDGADLTMLGDVAGLVGLVGTQSADAVVLQIADAPLPTGGGDLDVPPTPSGKAERLDLSSGSTVELGSYPQAFTPLCAVGRDSLLGYTAPAAGQGAFTLTMVGPAAMSPELSTAAVGIWPTNPPRGCSADARFVYAPTASPGGQTLELERIGLADASRTVLQEAQVLPEELFVVTR
jgi:hypothetical protein